MEYLQFKNIFSEGVDTNYLLLLMKEVSQGWDMSISIYLNPPKWETEEVVIGKFNFED